MEIRYNQHGQCVHLSDEDVERLGQKYIALGGAVGTRVPFCVFVALEAQKLLESMAAANPVHRMTMRAARDIVKGGRLN